MTDRITRVEEKCLELERHLEALDGQVRELFDLLGTVGESVTRLRQDTERQFEHLDHRPEDDRPPHWGPPPPTEG